MASPAVAFLALFLVGLTCATSPQKKLGGFSDTKQATPAIQKVVDAVARDIRKQANLPSSASLTARKYISQAVAGTNYVVEINAGVGRSAKVIHASISADLRGKEFTLNSVKSAIIGDKLTSF